MLRWFLCTLLLGSRGVLLPGHVDEGLGAGLRRCAEFLRGPVLQNRLASASPHAPNWMDGATADFLLALDDAALMAAEAHGLQGIEAAKPPWLETLLQTLSSCEARLLAAPRMATGIKAFRMKQKKAEQVACCVEALRDHFDLPRVARVVDLGAGRGWLTRALREALAKPCVGLERDEAQVASARAAVNAEGLSQVSFEVCDLRSPETLLSLLAPQDLLVALHPCGRLGDLTIEALVSLPPARRPGLFLVSCCLHGRSWSPETASEALPAEIDFEAWALLCDDTEDQSPFRFELVALHEKCTRELGYACQWLTTPLWGGGGL
ncbi:hypothetical protein AK812_SmicGene15428 [Symbiodinium microadriaticum]|uniref:Methyltransferase domain-containing protein n=1 Tax=Symbiodinium microadriaticum TaxID=2951 RepID=A0A1Q9E306_SYMMI|nr:hypothetical protein AK812_SmicGene15428 [Symbiodinium microadriaticum]